MNFLTNNFQLKILALLSSVVLWFFVVGIENSVTLLPQEIEIKALNMPANLSLSSSLGTAKIRVRADSNTLKNLNTADFEVFVDLKELEAGDYTLKLAATSKNEKISVLKIEPPAIHLKLQSVQEKEVKIKVILNGKPQKGFKVGESKIDHSTAKLSGVKEFLDKINEVNAEIKLDGSESEDYSQKIVLDLPKNVRGNVQKVTITPEQVTASVTIKPDVTFPVEVESTGSSQVKTPGLQKVVIVKPSLQGDFDLSSWYQKIEIIPLTVVIQGDPDILKNVNFLETQPLSVGALQDPKKPIRVKVLLPPKVTLMNPLDSEVSVSVKSTSSDLSVKP